MQRHKGTMDSYSHPEPITSYIGSCGVMVKAPVSARGVQSSNPGVGVFSGFFIPVQNPLFYAGSPMAFSSCCIQERLLLWSAFQGKVPFLRAALISNQYFTSVKAPKLPSLISFSNAFFQEGSSVPSSACCIQERPLLSFRQNRSKAALACQLLKCLFFY
ncbi:unnamed protein product [Protopolystoma xenopodis]|uniref:Uncharacterized protein n=1 Tax=Protopolystoma xenopodis TaxID=117903 RepID=A0A3S5B178_9PLAT|nr:unnamed protein product [Protopolystoma xenopodis]